MACDIIQATTAIVESTVTVESPAIVKGTWNWVDFGCRNWVDPFVGIGLTGLCKKFVGIGLTL